MIFETIRVDLETFFRPLWEAKYANIELITEGSKAIDLTDRVDPFLQLDINYRGGSEQLTMNGADPRTLFKGLVVCRLFVKEFSGRKQVNEGLDFISNTLGYASVGAMVLKNPDPQPSATAIGWHRGVLAIPFQFDTLKQPT